MIKFPLAQKNHQFELSYGTYNIYFTGGFTFENIDGLYIHLFDCDNGETITLIEKSVFGATKRDMILGKKAILCYHFNVYKNSNLKLEIENPEILLVKEGYDTIFSRLGLFPNKYVAIDSVEVVIK